MDSRDAGDSIRRRRECLNCGKRFTTYERVEAENLFIVKKSGRREPFDRAKLLGGIRKACEKRPLPTGAVDRLVDGIEADLLQSGRAEVPSSVVGDMVIERLKALDHIAYIRFASVYREFRDLEDVRREMESLVPGAAGKAGGETPTQLPLLDMGPGLEQGPRRSRKRR